MASLRVGHTTFLTSRQASWPKATNWRPFSEVKNTTTDVLDKKTAGLKEAKQNTNAALDKQTADLKQTQDKVNQTRKDVNAVAKDPVKAAATAVINQG